MAHDSIITRSSQRFSFKFNGYLVAQHLRLGLDKTAPSRPDPPRRRPAAPQVVEVLIFAISVHRIEEAVMAIRHQLSIGRQLLQGLTLEDAIVPAQVIEHCTVEHEEAGAHPSVTLGLLNEALHAIFSRQFQHAKTGDGWNRSNG